MSERNGGPAFPRESMHPCLTGMSLRDYFAAHALSGILASPHLTVTKPAPELAINCYAIADAMLAERAK